MAQRMVLRLCGLFGIVVLSGCRPSAPPVFPTWFTPPAEYVPAEQSSNAFDAYARAAGAAKSADPVGISRVSFTPGQKAKSLQHLEPSMKIMVGALGQGARLPSRAFSPFQAMPYQSEWRHLGRAFLWRLDSALEEKRSGDAERTVQLISQFSFDLMGGSAMDADLGLTLLDDMRKVILGRIDRLEPSLQASLANLLTKQIPNNPWLEPTLDQERMRMMASVQAVQDAYEKQDDKQLRELLGPEVREAIEYFKRLRGKSGTDQVQYFTGFAKEVDVELALIRSRMALPVNQRPDYEDMEGARPWRRFSKHLVRTMRPLLLKADRTETRTKMLILDLRIRAVVQVSGFAPADLTVHPENLRLDPYSGKSFSYDADGPAYKLYSVGVNGVDDGGMTDDSSVAPDLTLERP